MSITVRAISEAVEKTFAFALKAATEAAWSAISARVIDIRRRHHAPGIGERRIGLIAQFVSRKPFAHPRRSAAAGGDLHHIDGLVDTARVIAARDRAIRRRLRNGGRCLRALATFEALASMRSAEAFIPLAAMVSEDDMPGQCRPPRYDTIKRNNCILGICRKSRAKKIA